MLQIMEAFTLLSYTYPMLNTAWELAMADAILFLNLMHVLPSNEEIARPTPCSSSTHACRHNLLLPHISCSVFLMAITSNRLHMSQPPVFMEAPTTLPHSGMALYASTYSDLERGNKENGWTVLNKVTHNTWWKRMEAGIIFVFEKHMNLDKSCDYWCNNVIRLKQM
jgi:hypothetical protein